MFVGDYFPPRDDASSRNPLLIRRDFQNKWIIRGEEKVFGRDRKMPFCVSARKRERESGSRAERSAEHDDEHDEENLGVQ